MEKYYITTSIFYATGKPHIGNMYEVVLADAIARYKRLIGFDVNFQTGTDEHGQKIEEKAKSLGLEPKVMLDDVVKDIKSLFDQLDISYDKFVRTTDEYHKEQVQHIFKKLYEQGDIYKGEYNGKYCKDCESFFTESQLIDGKCPDCGREVVFSKEEAYFLKLSKYSERLKKHIEENPEFIQPESRKNEMMNNFIIPGLQDLCVSRTSIKWGIPVDFDSDHTVYVWIDALSNYITGIGYDLNGNHGDNFKKYWPADVHLIGKDILRFHTIYWPIVLMALNVELPKQVFGHPWLLVGEGKMSKSKGNVIYSDELCELFGSDAVRYIMLREIPFAQDGRVTYESMIERVNTDLANVLGNLVNRTISMVNKYFSGEVKKNDSTTEFDLELIESVQKLPELVTAKIDELKVNDALEEIHLTLRKCNKYIDETCPWTLAKEEAKKEILENVLYNLLESIRVSAILLKAFIPVSAEKILSSIGANLTEYEENIFGKQNNFKVVETTEILFERLDEKEVFTKIEKMREKIKNI